MVKKLVLLSLLVVFSILPSVAKAAVLYLEPPSDYYHPGDTFIVEAKIDVEGECINLVGVDLNFSQDILEVVDFSQGSSILTFWIKSPTIDQKSELISFTGGVPGGYCGRLPGDPGESNLLSKIIFKVQETTQIGTQINTKIEFLDTSQVLLNDGLGTPAKLITKEAIFTILPEKLEVPRDEWRGELEKDKIPPEPFIIEINQDPAIFEGKYFIIFSTTDKQTGIDHYEVKEGEKDWKMGESPYLLEDQNLQSIIKVKAVDKAENERIAEYLPPSAKKLKPFSYWTIFTILVSVAIIVWIINRFVKKEHRKIQKT